MAASSLKGHMERQNVRSVPQTSEVEIWRGGEPVTYVVSLTWVLKTVRCPVTGCLAVAYSTVRLRENFMYRHFLSQIVVVQ